jgi:hypothetical protein
MATTSKYKVLRAVTHAVLKLANGQPRAFYLIAPMYVGKEIAAAAGQQARAPATLVHAVDIETGEEGVVICPMVMQKELNEAYPGETYVGRCFEILKTRDMEKKYNHVGITEIAPPDEFTPPASAAALAAAAPTGGRRK